MYILYWGNGRDLKSSGLLIYDLIVIFTHKVWLRSWKIAVELTRAPMTVLVKDKIKVTFILLHLFPISLTLLSSLISEQSLKGAQH